MRASEERKPTTASYLLRLALQRSNMTARQLAQKTGVSEGRISNYLHGKHDPTVGQFAKLCNALGVSLSLTGVVEANDHNGITLAQLLDLSDAILVGTIRRSPRDLPGTFHELINAE